MSFSNVPKTLKGLLSCEPAVTSSQPVQPSTSTMPLLGDELETHSAVIQSDSLDGRQAQTRSVTSEHCSPVVASLPSAETHSIIVLRESFVLGL